MSALATRYRVQETLEGNWAVRDLRTGKTHCLTSSIVKARSIAKNLNTRSTMEGLS